MSTGDAQGARELTLSVEGMTCASCVARVEKKLSKLPGVQAQVNLATARARVFAPPAITAEQLISTIEKAGYHGALVEESESAAEAPGTAASRAGADQGAGAVGPIKNERGTGSPTSSAEGETAETPGSSTPESGSDPTAQTETDSELKRIAELRRRLLVAFVLGIPVIAISMIPALQFAHWRWVVGAATVPIASWCAWPFHRAAFQAGRHGATTMDTLVSLGVIAAFCWSTWVLFTDPHQHLHFETAAMIVLFLLLGRFLEARSRRTASQAFRALLNLGAQEANRVLDPANATLMDAPRTERIAASELAVGDIISVRAGEKIACDGIVEKGSSEVDTSLLTGEAMPVLVGKGDEVTGATVVINGHVLVRATRIGKDSTLAAISRLVEQAQAEKAPIQRLADRISAVFVPAVLIFSALTLTGWLLTGHSLSASLTAAIATLVVACPCALGLATPTALLVGTGRASQLGILLRGPQILEATRAVTAVVFDKTGTLTTGDMRVHTIASDDAARALTLAASIESGSAHPIAHAIVTEARERDLPLLAAEHIDSVTGEGVIGLTDGQWVRVGRPNTAADAPAGDTAPAQTDTPATVVEVATAEHRTGPWQAIGHITIADDIRSEAPEALRQLADLGAQGYLLTGDNAASAHAVAEQLAIPGERVRAEVYPQDKIAYIRQLQNDGHTVAMIGDGVNDAAALAQADLGISLDTGSDVAREASDVTLIGANLERVPAALRISRATLGIIKQNLGWAFGYNGLAIPLAAFGVLAPGIAAALMASSSVIVVMNSLRLRRAS